MVLSLSSQVFYLFLGLMSFLFFCSNVEKDQLKEARLDGGGIEGHKLIGEVNPSCEGGCNSGEMSEGEVSDISPSEAKSKGK